MVELRGTQARITKSKKKTITVGFEPDPSHLLDKRVIHCAIDSTCRLAFKGILYSHILQCFKSNQSEGGNMIHFNCHLMIYRIFNDTIFSKRVSALYIIEIKLYTEQTD